MSKGTRTVATIWYTEHGNLPNEEIIKAWHIPYVISPVHDKDVDDDGVLKKPHRHILFLNDSQKAESTWEKIIKSFGGVGMERVQNRRAYIRYLIHEDDPEKPHYEKKDIIAYLVNYIYIEQMFEEKITESSESMMIKLCELISTTGARSINELILFHAKTDTQMLEFINKNVFLTSQLIKGAKEVKIWYDTKINFENIS